MVLAQGVLQLRNNQCLFSHGRVPGAGRDRGKVSSGDTFWLFPRN
jgi:hypothetical protein